MIATFAALLHPMLAYRPFIDSLEPVFPDAYKYWLWLLVPLVVAISIVYKCMKVRTLRRLPWEASKMSLQIIVAMALAAAALYYMHAAGIRLM